MNKYNINANLDTSVNVILAITSDADRPKYKTGISQKR